MKKVFLCSIEQDFGDPRPPSEGLMESGRAAGLAQEQPDGRHCRRAGAELQAQLDFGST
jgi:hypothetical protein